MASNSRFFFLKPYKTLTEVLTDHNLASLGDAYVNLVYSLALSSRNSKPFGAKVKGKLLAEAIRKAELRGHLPSRMTRHKLADAAEALMIYAWLNRCISLEESVTVLQRNEDQVEGFRQLLAMVKTRVRLS